MFRRFSPIFRHNGWCCLIQVIYSCIIVCTDTARLVWSVGLSSTPTPTGVFAPCEGCGVSRSIRPLCELGSQSCSVSHLPICFPSYLIFSLHFLPCSPARLSNSKGFFLIQFDIIFQDFLYIFGDRTLLLCCHLTLMYWWAPFSMYQVLVTVVTCTRYVPLSRWCVFLHTWYFLSIFYHVALLGFQILKGFFWYSLI